MCHRGRHEPAHLIAWGKHVPTVCQMIREILMPLLADNQPEIADDEFA
jgi:hypothetical protein